MREIEARLLRIDQRTLLLHVFAQHLPQRQVQQMRGRVVLHDVEALAVDLQLYELAHFEHTFGKLANVQYRVAQLLSAFDDELPRAAGDRAGIADLPSLLGIEAGLIEDEADGLAGQEDAAGGDDVVLDPAEDGGFDGETGVLQGVVGSGKASADGGNVEFPLPLRGLPGEFFPKPVVLFTVYAHRAFQG